MPYADRNPNDDLIFFFKILIFVLLAFYLLFGITKTVFGAGEGDWVDLIGYYCAPETEAITPDGYYIFNEITSHYLGYVGLPDTSVKYGLTFEGVVGNSTYITSHSLGEVSKNPPFDKSETDNWTEQEPEQGDDFYVGIVALEEDCVWADLKIYFETGGTPPCSAYGTIPFKWGEVSDEINFDEPQGFQYGNAPIDLDISGDYFIAPGEIYWDGIQVEMTFYSPFGTTTPSVYYEYIVFQNSQNEGEGTFDSEVDDINWTAAIDGSYAYRARFYYEVYDYMGFSEWIYNEGLYYWIFSAGDYDLSTMPEMEDYFATTTDFGLLGNMFRDVLIYLFKPNESVLDFWRTIKDRVADKPPFGYYGLIRQAFDNFTSEATPAFTLASATSTAEYIFTPLKSGLGWILWILFGVWFLKRFVHFVV
ncbi:unnamed protein product [marine sediment metagenome]|uniref:Uncharacterized protein n=1 Tax=marine sediment metagenome TaxID=412755 RepID=X1LHK6_9ZZZZ